MTVLSTQQIMGYARASGFTGNAINWITAIALAESGGSTAATNTAGNSPPSTDRGLLQINSYWHKEVDDTCAFSPLCAMQAAYKISQQGTNFTPWSSYGNGQAEIRYREILGMNEVCKIVNVSQFYPSKTQYACVFYATGSFKYAGKDKPTGTPQDVENWADAQYTAMWGSDGITMIDGASVPQAHTLIINAGLHYQDLLAINANSGQDSDVAQIKASLALGYPVMVTVAETSVYDLDLGRNPYFWGASGEHELCITGMADDKTFLVHDSANVRGSLNGPNTVLPGPRRYDASRLSIQWATMIKTDWLPAIPVGFDPTKDTLPAQEGDIMTPIKAVYNKDLKLEDNRYKEAIAIWEDLPSWASGIADRWRRLFANGIHFGTPTTTEIKTVNDGGEPIAIRYFAMGARIEYNLTNGSVQMFIGVTPVVFI